MPSRQTMRWTWYVFKGAFRLLQHAATVFSIWRSRSRLMFNVNLSKPICNFLLIVMIVFESYFRTCNAKAKYQDFYACTKSSPRVMECHHRICKTIVVQNYCAWANPTVIFLLPAPCLPCLIWPLIMLNFTRNIHIFFTPNVSHYNWAHNVSFFNTTCTNTIETAGLHMSSGRKLQPLLPSLKRWYI